jgi:hypothetical protein
LGENDGISSPGCAAVRAGDGEPARQRTARIWLLSIPFYLVPELPQFGLPAGAPDLSTPRREEAQHRIREAEARNSTFFDEEMVKLDPWSDDLMQGLEHELKELDRLIREAQRASALAGSL